jgi:hypothetical protein
MSQRLGAAVSTDRSGDLGRRRCGAAIAGLGRFPEEAGMVLRGSSATAGEGRG